MRALKETCLILAVAGILAAVSWVWHPPSTEMRQDTLAEGEVTLTTAREWSEKVLWLDARSQADYQTNHIPGALLLNEDRWNDLVATVLEKWQPERVIVVYCGSQSCKASHQVAKRLREEMGLSPVHVLHGGWEAWQTALKDSWKK